MTFLITKLMEASPSGILIFDLDDWLSSLDPTELFTHFYTTKPYGQGIGLTLTREILMNHPCRFELKSDKEKRLIEFVIQF